MYIPKEMLTSLRVRRVFQELQDPRELVGNLVFSARTPTVPAEDGEITMRYVIRPQMSDIVAPNSKALTYPIGRMRFENYVIPKIKHGRSLDETMISDIRSMENLPTDVELGPWRRFEQTIMETNRADIAFRREAMVIGMWTDSFDYDRLGMKMHGVSWGMPAVIKTTVGVAWSDATNSTPISDVLTYLQIAQVEFGIYFDRMTMSLTVFNYMTRSAEFSTRARMYVVTAGLNPNAPLPFQNVQAMLPIAGALLGNITIELYDQRAFIEAEDGTQSSVALLPINKVVFSIRAFDNNPAVFDLANTRVPEAAVAEQPGLGIIGRVTDGRRGNGLSDYGPMAYVSGAHNPPEYIYWAAQRCFPRKHRVEATGCMTVGAFTDYIPIYEPLLY